MTDPSSSKRKPNYLQRRLVVGGAAVLVVILLVFGLISLTSSSSVTTTTTTTNPVLSTKTLPGPDGVEAAWVVAENKLKGTSAWQIPPNATPNVIAGFSNLNYAATGQTATFYVTTPSPTFTVVAYRMGYYHGLGGRQVWKSPVYKGTVQATCPLTPGINLVSCDNWTPSFSVKITKKFVQGDYLFKLTGANGEMGYVPLTVWDPTSKATYLVVNRTFTEEGWNYWGGYDFYQGLGTCAPTYPVCNRARVVSLDRPFNTGFGASDFFGNEYPLISFMEQHGLDLTYVTDITLDAQPNIQSNHKVILSLGHDETWSTPQRQGAEAAKAKGTNLVFFGSAAVLRHVRMESSPLGPERIEVNYRDSAEDPLNGKGDPLYVTGNTFASPPTNWSEIPLTGQEYAGYLSGTNNVPFVVADGTAWPFAGTGVKTGTQLPGVIMSDIDHVSIPAGSPTNVQILGHSPVPTSIVYTNQGTWNGFTYSDMTYYNDPTSKAGVIDTGVVNWIYAMSNCSAGIQGCPTATIQKITGNILKVFGQGPAGLTHPSVPNWATIQPLGS